MFPSWRSRGYRVPGFHDSPLLCSGPRPRCIISRMFTCPACHQPDLHFHSTMKDGELIERRVRCAACGHDRPITLEEMRSLLAQDRNRQAAKKQGQGS